MVDPWICFLIESCQLLGIRLARSAFLLHYWQMNRTQLLYCFLCFLPNLIFGQVDTLLQLPVVEVRNNSIRQQPLGAQVQSWDSKTLDNTGTTNLADLLNRESTIYIKSYGLNSLATSSIRGASAGQTLVLWNGLPIQSPMLGLLDLSLIPSFSAEQVKVQRGGSSALWGNGAIGGTIQLNNLASFDKSWSGKLETLLGAFGNWQQQAQVEWSNDKLFTRTKFSHQQGENNFTYRINEDLPEKTQTNAAFDQQHFLQDFYWKLRSNQRLSAHLWYLQSDRQIPPTTTQNLSLATQADQAIRSILQWQLNQDQWIYQAKLAYFTEDIHFIDEAILLDAPSKFTTLMGEAEAQYFFNKSQQITFGLSQMRNTANADGYPAGVTENRSDAFLSYRMQRAQSGIQLSLRQSIINNKYSPIVPSLGLDYRPAPAWRLHFQFSRNYRWPTLNDRYWNPGGNPDLIAEEGWSQELGATWQWSHKKTSLEFSATIFNRNIKDWILWSPLEGQGIWSAKNIAKVWSRGLETSAQYKITLGRMEINSKVSYDYIRSTNEVALTLPSIAKGDQLIYTPIHQGLTSIQLKWNNHAFSYLQHFTGSSKGVNRDIDAFTTAELRYHFHWKWGKQKISTFATLHNLWDANYQVIERRPMPGRYAQIGLRLNFE